MKDFAKSIHVGNAGEVVHRDGDFKIKYNEKENGYELYYKSIYYDTYHTKQQALDKIELHKKREEDRKKSGNSKVGNIKDDAKAKKLYAEMMDAKDIAEEWARATHAQKGDNLESGRKTAEEAYRKAKKAYESYAMNSDGTEKLFHSLKKDVEEKEEDNDEKIEEVGNAGYSMQLKPGQHVSVRDSGSEWDVKILRDNKDGTYEVKTQWGSVATIREENIVKVGNSKSCNKTGNSSEYDILKQDPSKMHPAYKKAYEEALKKLSKEDEEMKKRFEREYGVKAKNEASDDKFAYVMREFDEGKLKTPDGKVVTDPAQAKAIAYSESKKTENGCARARNAIKK